MVADDMAERLREVAFSQPIGEVADPIERPYGWHIILVTARQDAAPQPVEESRLRIRDLLNRQRYRDELERYLMKAREEAEWCVKKAYRGRLNFESPECRVL